MCIQYRKTVELKEFSLNEVVSELRKNNFGG